MILNSFTNRSQYISYRIDGEIIPCDGVSNPDGLFEYIDSTFVAFYCLNDEAIIKVGDKKFSIKDSAISLCFDNEGEYCKFSIKEFDVEIFEFRYPSWWIRRESNFIVGFGQPDDDEEDLLAYITMMCEKSDTRNHLINVYSGKYLEP